MRKKVIICRCNDEMERKADKLIEQGYEVEREIDVQPLQQPCIPIYRITFWK